MESDAACEQRQPVPADNQEDGRRKGPWTEFCRERGVRPARPRVGWRRVPGGGQRGAGGEAEAGTGTGTGTGVRLTKVVLRVPDPGYLSGSPSSRRVLSRRIRPSPPGGGLLRLRCGPMEWPEKPLYLPLTVQAILHRATARISCRRCPGALKRRSRPLCQGSRVREYVTQITVASPEIEIGYTKPIGSTEKSNDCIQRRAVVATTYHANEVAKVRKLGGSFNPPSFVFAFRPCSDLRGMAAFFGLTRPSTRSTYCPRRSY